MTTLGTWYAPAAGTGGFLSTLTNPPFATMSDPINHPAHYTAGPIESINVIEQTVAHAPEPILAGLQWQALKYLLRLWHKGAPLEDARKARWYLNRFIDRLAATQEPRP